MKSLNSDKDFQKKKYKNLNKKKVFMIVSEIFIGGIGLSIGGGLTTSEIAPAGLLCASAISFLSSISTLITNEYFSKKNSLY